MSCGKCLRWIFCMKLPVRDHEVSEQKQKYKAIRDTEDGRNFDQPIQISGELTGEPSAMTVGGLASTSIFKKISEWSLPVKKEPKTLFNMSRGEISFFEDDHVLDEFINN